MNRLLFVLPLLAACPPPTEPPPVVPSRIDQPPPTPDVETCDADPATLPFASTWTPVTYAPLPADPDATVYTGTLRIPSDLGLPLDDVRVYGVTADISHIVDDGTTITATYTANATCTGVCEWNEVELHSTSGVLLLQGAGTELSLASTALLALDLSRARAAARNGPSGVMSGDEPDLDAAVPAVVAAMEASIAVDGTTGIASGGAPVVDSEVFDAVDAALADDTVPAPTVPASAGWQLHTLTVPDGARLVVLDGHRVSLPMEPGPDGELAWHTLQPVDSDRSLVLRFLFADGRQSPAAVTRQTPSTATTPASVVADDGDTVSLSDATPASWMLQRSNSSVPLRGACKIDDTGTARMAVDPTTGFSLLEVASDLQLRSLLACTWTAGVVDCTTP